MQNEKKKRKKTRSRFFQRQSETALNTRLFALTYWVISKTQLTKGDPKNSLKFLNCSYPVQLSTLGRLNHAWRKQGSFLSRFKY